MMCYAEHSCEPSDFMKGCGVFGVLSDCQLLKNASAAWSSESVQK
jgi:hypothetical protein